MRVPVSWLTSYVGDLGGLDELTAMLDDLGLVVEGVTHVGASLDGIVVARVESIDAIEGADRIRLATVTDGSATIEVVCGAWNYEVGSLVPFAPVGTVLPDGTEISRRTMRGAVSNGMLCSGRELGVGDDHAGLLLLDDLDGAVPGRPVGDVLDVRPDVVLDLSIEGNRPDAWCVEGVARDVAARLARPFARVEPPALAVTDGADPAIEARIDDPDLCGRLVVTVLDHVVVGPSPSWIARRLQDAGMRPINNVVDASNYVMLELGQPTHPYDLTALSGGIAVRRAREGERLELLDGTELELAVHSGVLGDTGEDLVICDGRDVPVGLAGIMGGATSGVAATTTSVALEAAWFEPLAVARSSKRHRLRSEASVRFERGCDWANCERATRRFVELLSESSPGLRVVSAPLDVRGTLPEPAVLEIDAASLSSRLGVAVPLDEVSRLLAAIGFGVVEHGSTLTVAAPTGRPDVRPEPFGVADVAEEVARLHGYSRLPARMPTWAEPGGLLPRVAARRVVREALIGIGGLEAWSATMVAEHHGPLVGDDAERVRVTNPMSAEAPTLRSSLLPGLLSALSRNVERRQGEIALFEFGTVFTHPSHAASARLERGGPGGGELLKVPSEEERVCALLGREGDGAASAVAAWRAVGDALRLEGFRLERDDRDSPPHGVHATRYARIVDAVSRSELGIVGEVDPDVVSRAVPALDGSRRLGWLDCSMAALADPQRATRRSEDAHSPSRYPSSDVDLALVVKEDVNVDDVKQVLRRAAGELCESVACFDAYRGAAVPEGHRSLAMRVRLCALDRTLTEAELASTREAMIAAAAARLSATLR